MFKRGGVWRTNIRFNGRRIQKSLETENKKLAEQIEAKIRTQLAEGKYLEKPEGGNKTVAQMLDKLVAEHGSKVSPKMLRSYGTSIGNLSPVLGQMILTEVQPRDIARYKRTRLEAGRKPATVNRELACLSKAFSMAVREWEWLKDNPVSKVAKEKEDNVRIRWLSLTEEAGLLRHCPAWLADIAVFAINTGMRKNEILSLKWQQVNLFRKEVVVLETKNGEPRTVPLNSTALKLLLAKSKVRALRVDFVFPSEVGTKLEERNINRAFSAALKKASITNFRFHDLRHTFATRMVQEGIDLYTVQRLLGQKTASVTMRYAHHNTQSLRKGVDAIVGCNLATDAGVDGGVQPEGVEKMVSRAGIEPATR